MRMSIKTLIIVGITAICLIPRLAVVSMEGVTFSQPRFEISGTEVFVLQNGTLEFGVSMENDTTEPQKGILVLGLYNEDTSLLTKVASDIKTAASGETVNFSASINVDNAAQYYVSASVWDSVNGMNNLSQLYHIGQTNVPPEPPNGLMQSDTSLETITLQWESAYHGVRVESYDVYREGVPIGNTTSPSFIDSDITKSHEGTSHTYTIKAIDPTGGESEPSVPVTAETAKYGEIIFNSFTNPESYYVTAINSNDANVVSEVPSGHNGNPCIEIKSNQYLNFNVDSALIGANDTTVTVYVTYSLRFAMSGANGSRFEWAATDGDWGPTRRQMLNSVADTEWYTDKILITNAKFGANAFRISNNSGGWPLYIHKVVVYKGDVTE